MIDQRALRMLRWGRVRSATARSAGPEKVFLAIGIGVVAVAVAFLVFMPPSGVAGGDEGGDVRGTGPHARRGTIADVDRSVGRAVGRSVGVAPTEGAGSATLLLVGGRAVYVAGPTVLSRRPPPR